MSERVHYKKVLIIGESCRDKFIYCDINRLCPEAPVPVLNPVRIDENPGMAANVYANLKSLSENWLDLDWIFPDKEIVKTRYLDKTSGYMICRVDEGDKVEPITLSHVFQKLKDNIYNAVVISDYNKGFLSSADIGRIAEQCDTLHVPIFVDTKKILGAWSHYVDYIKINEKEYNEQLKYSLMPEGHCKNLIVTYGSRGSMLIGRAKTLEVSVEPVEVSNVSGAGDTYLAGLVYSHVIRGERFIQTSMDYANRAARIAVSKPGVVAVNGSEIKD